MIVVMYDICILFYMSSCLLHFEISTEIRVIPEKLQNAVFREYLIFQTYFYMLVAIYKVYLQSPYRTQCHVWQQSFNQSLSL